MATNNTLGQVISWWICTFAALIFLLVRLIVRWSRFGKIYTDDYLLILAFFCLAGDLGIQQHMWNLGVSDLGNVTRSEYVGIMQMIIPGSTLYVTSLWAIKLSLVLFYKRLAARTTLQMVYNITMIGLIVTWIGLVLFDVFECYPVHRKWTTNPKEQCSAEISTINYWVTILLNIFSDIFIMALPVSMVIRMRLPMKQKVGIVGVFCLGFCVVIASIIRAYYSHRNEVMLTSTVSMIETAIAIIATCLPALRTLIYTSKSRTGSSPMYPYNAPHYELSSPGGQLTTKIAGGTKNKSRASTVHPKANNWPFPGDRGGTIAKPTNDSDESLFRPVDTDKSIGSTNTAEIIDPSTLGVLPDVVKDRKRSESSSRDERKRSNENHIIVSTSVRVERE